MILREKKLFFFEDIPKNLINPKIAGFQTVLIKSSSHPDSNTDLLEAEKKHFKHIDHVTYNITASLEQIYLDMSN